MKSSPELNDAEDPLASFPGGNRIFTQQLVRPSVILIDEETRVVLAVSSNRYSVNHMADILHETKVQRVSRLQKIPLDFDRKFYVFMRRNATTETVRFEPMDEAQVSGRLRERKALAMYTMSAFDRLIGMLASSRVRYHQSSDWDPLVIAQIERELEKFEREKIPGGYIRRYAHVHEITVEAAACELRLRTETIHAGLQKTQELFWFFKRKLIMNPLRTEAEFLRFDEELLSEFVLTYRV